ncbi:MAG: hypothetical protein KGJ93_04590, partial [Patescibacteria group bacterium]|nr:hypothetical protein [Patescibacteria group bacterium]
VPWQSSGGFGNWMGNGAFLYNIYGSNVNSITNTVQNIQQNGWSADNVMALGADAASVVAKTSGVIVGGAATGMAAGAASPYVGAAASKITAGQIAKAGTGVLLNIGATALEGKVEGRDISWKEYAYAGISGAAVPNIGGSWAVRGFSGGLSNAIGQVMFRTSNDYDLTSVGISAAAGMIPGIGKYSSAPQVYRFMTEQVAVWTVETPAQVINSGIQKSLEQKK